MEREEHPVAVGDAAGGNGGPVGGKAGPRPLHLLGPIGLPVTPGDLVLVALGRLPGRLVDEQLGDAGQQFPLSGPGGELLCPSAVRDRLESLRSRSSESWAVLTASLRWAAESANA